MADEMADGPKSELVEQERKSSVINPDGLERLKGLITSSDSDLFLNASLATGVASILGFCIGGRLGARVSGSDHILGNQLTPYQNKVQAHRAYHSAVIDGFVRNGSRWGWRAGVFAGLYSAVMTIMAEYRNKYDGVNMVVAGAATGATYKLLSGFRGIIVGTVLGSFFSLPMAVVAQAVTWVIPEGVKESIRKLEDEKKETKRRKNDALEPWQKNLGFTEKMIKQMETELGSKKEDQETTSR